MQSRRQSIYLRKNVHFKIKIIFQNETHERRNSKDTTKRVFNSAFPCGIIAKDRDMRKDTVCK